MGVWGDEFVHKGPLSLLKSLRRTDPTKIHQNAPKHARIHQNTKKIHQNPLKHIRIHQNTSKNTQKHIRIHQNTTGIHQHTSENTQNTPKYTRTHQNTSKHTKTYTKKYIKIHLTSNTHALLRRSADNNNNMGAFII